MRWIKQMRNPLRTKKKSTPAFPISKKSPRKEAPCLLDEIPVAWVKMTRMAAQPRKICSKPKLVLALVAGCVISFMTGAGWADTGERRGWGSES